MAINVRYAARLLMPKAIAQGISRNAFMGVLQKEFGVGYRRQTFLRDWSEMAGIPQKQDVLKYVRKPYRPTAASITETEGPQTRLYVYHYEATGLNEVTGQIEKTGMAVSSDHLLTIEEAEEEALKNMDWYNPEVKLSKFEILSVTQRK